MVSYLGSQHEAGQRLERWGERRGQHGGSGPFMPCCLGKNCHFTFQLGGTPGSVSSATRGKWAQPWASPIIINELSLRVANLFVCKLGHYGATGNQDSLENLITSLSENLTGGKREA